MDKRSYALSCYRIKTRPLCAWNLTSWPNRWSNQVLALKNWHVSNSSLGADQLALQKHYIKAMLNCCQQDLPNHNSFYVYFLSKEPWVQYLSSSTGKIYYHNRTTQESVYDPPASATLPYMWVDVQFLTSFDVNLAVSFYKHSTFA